MCPLCLFASSCARFRSSSCTHYAPPSSRSQLKDQPLIASACAIIVDVAGGGKASMSCTSCMLRMEVGALWAWNKLALHELFCTAISVATVNDALRGYVCTCKI